MSIGYLRRCAGKIKYPDKESANNERKSMVRAGKLTLSGSSAYRCNQCGGWHIGHDRGRKRRR